MIPYMARMAMSLDVNGIFMEVHSDPDKSKCDAPTQWPLEKIEEIILLKNKFYHKPRNYSDIICCIPARLQSERLPEKLLLKINNKTIIQHVYNNVEKSKYIDNIVVLTDSEKIKETINKIGGSC